jgi:ABC-type multidrug transport system, ATPase component
MMGVIHTDAIRTTALTKIYKNGKVAVDGLELTVKQGELFALLGVNGAGKTTAIKMMCCLIPPTSGGAEILGFDIAKQPREVKMRLGVSPQETAVAPALSVRENLELMRGVYGHNASDRKSKADEIIDRFGLGEVARDKAKTLSGGWQRRLSIAMALVSEPELLFLDEPTLGLDVLARRELWKVIESLKGKITVILTTHYLEEATALSDRIAVMASGRLAAVGNADELIAKTGTINFEEAFVSLAGGNTVGGVK